MKKSIIALALLFICCGIVNAQNVAENDISWFEKISPGDILEISLYVSADTPQRSFQARVSGSGIINYPPLTDVKVAGLTEFEAGKKIEDLLKEKKYYVNPQVVVWLARENRAGKVTMLGAVAGPGNIPCNVPYTLTQIIAQAGGLATWPPYIKPDPSHIRVLRKEGEGEKVYVLDLEKDGRSFYVRPNDVVILDQYEPLAVRGDVAQPGTYRMRSGYTLADAIAEAGGVSQNADAQNIKVLRIEGGVEKEYDLDLDTQGIYFLMKQHDRVLVTAYGTISIFGEVMRPGKYYIKKDLTAVNLIFAAGGLTDFANPNGVKVVRKAIKKGKEKRQVIRVPVGHMFKKGDLSKDVLLKPGDIVVVPEAWL